MKKNVKWLTALAAVGIVIGLISAFFCKKKKKTSGLDEDDFENEDEFELDGDLKPVSEREYVPLNKAADQPAQKAESEENEEARETEDHAEAESALDEEEEEPAKEKKTDGQETEEADSDKEQI